MTPVAMRAVGAWQERLGGLAGAVPAMQPSDSVWLRLEQRLFVSARVRRAVRCNGCGACSLSARSAACWRACCCVWALLRFQPALIGLEPQLDALPQSYVGLLTDVAGKPTCWRAPSDTAG